LKKSYLTIDMTVLEDALNGIASDELIEVAFRERIEKNKLLKAVSNGQAVIMKRKDSHPLGIGYPLRTKINVNLGTSSASINIEEELEKVKIAQKYGADTISDLSMGGDIDKIRKEIINNSTLPITTVPIYQAVVEAKSLKNVSEDIIFKVIEKQIKDGICSIVIHAAFSLENLEEMKGKRIMGIVSKGGSFTASIMSDNSIENPFFKNYDYILDIVKERDIIINLGNAMRSGCIHDPVDDFQLSEIRKNKILAQRANDKGIQVILESLGGHVNASEIITWVKKHKELTNNRPLFMSGPIPVDFAIGYDHISAAIGGAFASGFGADYLCAITPAEHLSLPSVEDIKSGLIACRIAAHVGDSMKYGLNHLFDDDLEIAKNRFQKNWQKQYEHSIDPEKPLQKHGIEENMCSMCGKYCALSISKKLFEIR